LTVSQDIAARRYGGLHGGRGDVSNHEHEFHTQKKKEAAQRRCGPFSYREAFLFAVAGCFDDFKEAFHSHVDKGKAIPACMIQTGFF